MFGRMKRLRPYRAWKALASGHFVEARNEFAARVVQAPEPSEGWLGLTLAWSQTGHRFAALGSAREACAADPEALKPHLILGAIQRQVGDVAGARRTLEAARERHPDDPSLLRLLSDVYRRARYVEDALTVAQRALALDASAASLVCLGDALLANECGDAAKTAYRCALAVDPRDVRAAFGLGRVALLAADWEGAHAAFERARAIDPNDADVRYNLALLDLRFGRYATGYAAYPAIMDSTSDEARYYYHHAGVPRWNGEPLGDRRLVVSSDHGLGDHIMMARFFDGLPSGAAVAIETPPPLLDLFARNFPWLRFERFTHWQPADTMDVHVPIMQLPCIAGIASAADIPGAPYLHADPARVAAWRARFAADSTLRHVGIVWHGNPINTRERWRAAPLAAWAPLAAVSGVRFHSLQFGATDAELADAPFALAASHRHLADFEDTAAAVAALDAVVTVDTSMVHLAGALGRPVWLANSLVSDFRWGVDGAETPWYPTVRIVRQPARDAWKAVFATIAREFG